MQMPAVVNPLFMLESIPWHLGHKHQIPVMPALCCGRGLPSRRFDPQDT